MKEAHLLMVCYYMLRTVRAHNIRMYIVLAHCERPVRVWVDCPQKKVISILSPYMDDITQ